jgi:hypothetical protein
VQRRQKLDRNAARGFLALRGQEILTKLSRPGLAFFLGDVPGNKEEVARTNNGDEGCHGRLNRGKRDFQSFETFVDGHWCSSI